MMNVPILFRFREPLATLPSLVVLAVLILAGVQKVTELKRKEDPQPVQISLTEIPPPPAPQPKPQVEPQPKPVEPPKKQEAPKPVAKPAPVKQAPAPVDPAPTSATAPILPATPPQPSAPAAPPVQSAPVAPPSPPPANTANIEQTYVGQLRAHLNSIKRYPTGREASTLRPQGKVRVWFVLKRDGSVVDSGIESSSNSMLLDDAARKTINRAAFAPFPEDSYKGESTHRFTADLEFIPV
ncbi:energy transducer TonB [Herbaspirillum huttiense]|uniref:energy transducer TonB n=1 Tax=Herbaspirillum huttiense TaxID=863372 RepID=UPI0021769BAB|nr:TonB family protein [Herbaspirillum huttiense]UWE16866.1 TonB family protein [Herbaspirillum huttiense]